MTEQSSSQSSTDAQAASAGLHPVLERLRGGLIASAQAYPGEPMRDPRTMDEVAQACVAGGGQIVALDGTRRPRPDGLSLAQTVEGLRRARPEVLIMADCGSLDDAKAAQDAGVDILGTTLAGYTGERPKTDGPDLELVDQVAGIAEIPLVVEGRVHTPAQAAAAMEHGAFAVVVGTAITHPTTITSWFANALPGALWKG